MAADNTLDYRTGPTPDQDAPREAILRATGIRRTFRMGDSLVEVLKGVDLTVRRGEFIAIEGRSGSGKSTLLHVLAGLDAPDAGGVDFDGRDIAALAIKADRYRRWLDRHARWLRIPGLYSALSLFADLVVLLMNRADRILAGVRNVHFGFVFQFYHLLPELNVLENTLLAPMIDRSWLQFRSQKRELTGRAREVLESLGLSHRLKHKPSQLSGGERQRVAIARALMNAPRVLFADEPTGNLDADTGRQIMSVLEKLHRDRGQTIVMVTHDRALARTADRALVLREGRLHRADELPEKNGG
jgi:lipoprotein-releasing system ATP-binding protein